MKKLFTALSVVLGLGLASAQQVATTKPSVPPAKGQKMQTAKNAKASNPTTPTSGIKLKKDGTPDKRYKTNKGLKKDGTPDKRYKTK